MCTTFTMCRAALTCVLALFVSVAFDGFVEAQPLGLRSNEFPDRVMLYGKSSVWVMGGSELSGGDSSALVGSSGSVTLANEAEVDGSVFGNRISLGNRTLVEGDVIALRGVFRGLGVDIEGELYPRAESLPNVRMPRVLTVTNPERDVNIRGWESIAGQRGEGPAEASRRYGDIVVEQNGTLYLKGGVIEAESLVLRDGAQVQVAYPTELRIRNSITVGRGTWVRLVYRAESAEDFKVFVSEGGMVSIGEDAIVHASISAPESLLFVGSGTDLRGTFLARHVMLLGDNEVQYEPGCQRDPQDICDGQDNDCDGLIDEQIPLCSEGATPVDPEPPALSPTDFPRVFGRAQFLFQGPNDFSDDLVQKGVSPDAIVPKRASRIRGQVFEKSFEENGVEERSPLSAVKVTITHHPEYGYTLTRDDGYFDLMINGGGWFVLEYEKEGYLPVQRKVEVRWQDYGFPQDVVMIPLDVNVTEVTLSEQQGMVVHQATVTEDEDGQRCSTILIPEGTEGTMRLQDGTEVPLDTVHFRSTEYTVGQNGPDAMPGELPPTSGYTYAVELSVDEALQEDAAQVMFNQPLVHYVENFLEFPVGGKVPLGYYDRQRAVWVPEDDGIVLEVLGTDAEGLALLDLTGDGQETAEDQAVIDARELNITQEERLRIAGLYQPGQSLWRVLIPHLTPWDCNWPYGPPPEAVSPPPPPEKDPEQPEDEPECQTGSIIECENQVLGQQMKVTGTPFSLHYRSSRVDGYRRNYRTIIPLVNAELPESLLGVDLEILIGGKVHRETFLPEELAPGFKYLFEWDGFDEFQRPLQGKHDATIRIGYTYGLQYYEPGQQFAQSFASLGNANRIIGNRENQTTAIWTEVRRSMGGWSVEDQGLGGWTLNIHHSYDAESQTLYRGDGTFRKAESNQYLIETVVGGLGSGGIPDVVGPGQEIEPRPAREVRTLPPNSLALDEEGNLYYSIYSFLFGPEGSIHKVTPDGMLHRVVGRGSFFRDQVRIEDGMLGLEAVIFGAGLLGFSTLGELVFMTDSRIFKLGSDQRISHLAGNGSFISGDQEDRELAEQVPGLVAPATEVPLGSEDGVVDPTSDELILVDRNYGFLRKISSDGNMRWLGGIPNFQRQTPPFQDRLVTEVSFQESRTIVREKDGNLLVTTSDRNTSQIIRIRTNGKMEVVAGGGAFEGNPNGKMATEVRIPGEIRSLAVGPDGSIYFGVAPWFDFDSPWLRRLWRISPSGVVHHIAGNGEYNLTDQEGLAAQVPVPHVRDIVVGEEGLIYFADYDGIEWGLVKKLTPVFPSLEENTYAIFSQNGSQVFEFDAQGRHLKTRDATTHELIYRFGYDETGKLITVEDGDGRETQIIRGDHGEVTGIVSSYGQQTSFSIEDNYLISVTDPDGRLMQFAYEDGGFMTHMTDALLREKHYSYDERGNLIRAEDANGAIKTLLRVVEEDGESTVTYTDPMERQTQYELDTTNPVIPRRIKTSPGGEQMVTVNDPSGHSTSIYPDGTAVETSLVADPIFGMFSPVASVRTRTTPSGLTSVVENEVEVVTEEIEGIERTVERIQISRTSERTTRIITTLGFEEGPEFVTKVIETPEGRRVTSVYDGQGRMVEGQAEGLYPTRMTYDVGLLRSIAVGEEPDVRHLTMTYNAEGFVASSTDAVGRVTTMDAYDEVGRLLQQTLPGDLVVGYTYDAVGNLTSLTTPHGEVHAFSYNAVNLESAYTPPEAGLENPQTTYAYNLDKQLTQVTRPDGEVIQTVYDEGGRLSEVLTPTGTYIYHYDEGVEPDEQGEGGRAPTGQLLSLQAPGLEADAPVTLSYTYDGFLVTQETWQGPVQGTVEMNYDVDGDQVSDFLVEERMVNGQHAVRFERDGDLLVTRAGDVQLEYDIRDENGEVIARNGLLTKVVVGNTESRYEYNGFGEVTRETHTFTDELGEARNLFEWTYDRDAHGRIVEKTETRLEEPEVQYTYLYDEPGRLVEVRTGAEGEEQLVEAYSHDENGNRLSVLTTEGELFPEDIEMDAQDRLLRYGNLAFTYTDNGELLEKTKTFQDGEQQTTRYDYDVFGNLRSVTHPDGQNIQYVIDGKHRRVGQTDGNAFEYGLLYKDVLNPIVKLDSDGNVTARFVYASKPHVPDYMTEGGAMYRFITDHLGSVRLLVNATTGQVTQQMSYSSFGQVIQDTNPGFQPFGFAGGLYEPETGLIRFGARDYDPQTGRWTSKDPIRFAGGDPNLYGYVMSDPINLIDPEGKGPISGGVCAAFFLGYGATSMHFANNDMSNKNAATRRNIEELNKELKSCKPGEETGIMQKQDEILSRADTYNHEIAENSLAGGLINTLGIEVVCIGIGVAPFFP